MTKKGKTIGPQEKLYKSTVEAMDGILTDVLAERDPNKIDFFKYGKRLDDALIKSVEGVGNSKAFSAYTRNFTLPFIHAVGEYATGMAQIGALPFVDTLDDRIKLLSNLKKSLEPATNAVLSAHGDGIAKEIGWKPGADKNALKLERYNGVLNHLKGDQKPADTSGLVKRLRDYENSL